MEHEDRLAVDGNSLQDPLALCHACGTRGTVGRATRKEGDREVVRAQYCAMCWPFESERHRAQWDGEIRAWFDSSMTSVEPTCAPFGASLMGPLTWYGMERFARDQLLPVSQSETPASREAIAAIAAEHQELGAEYLGAMPPLVALFIRAFANPTNPTNPSPAT